MSRWTQPICERDWIEQRGVWEGDRLVSLERPHLLKEPEVERCSYCGGATIFGAYVRADPATVPFPPLEETEPVS